MAPDAAWRPSLGAVARDGGVAFRAWARDAPEIALVLKQSGDDSVVPLTRDGEYVTASIPGIAPGTRYAYRIGGQDVPDPCSRGQPDGVHAPSEVVDPNVFAWTDAAFSPPAWEDAVVYELHIGTFTPPGTFDAAAEALPRLRDLGVNAVEVMPVAAFPGARNWGYDGVGLFAPAAVYGGPEGFRRFVDAAHALRLAVILDVVYNHFGPDGNYAALFSRAYTTANHHTPWGDAVNFDGDGASGVREFVRENLLHWTHEYHVDGFRFDATHAIRDDSPVHILAEVAEALQGEAPGGRTPWLIAESHENDVRYLRPRAQGGFGFDAVWADDFHHAVRTMVHDDHEGYFASYRGSAAELARTVAQGFLYEGQFDPYAGAPRGTAARDQPWSRFLYCIQNHDQVGNRAFGLRLNVTAGSTRFLAATALLLLLPQTPLLFQGQEYLAGTPFLYFTDHHGELGPLVTEGRRDEFASFAAFRDPRTRDLIPDPQAESTFLASRLDLAEASRPPGMLSVALHRELLHQRATDPVLRAARRQREGLRATPLEEAVVLVELENAAGRAMIAANLGPAATVHVQPGFELVVHSDEGRFGGFGRPITTDGGVISLPAETSAYFRMP